MKVCECTPEILKVLKIQTNVHLLALLAQLIEFFRPKFECVFRYFNITEFNLMKSYVLDLLCNEFFNLLFELLFVALVLDRIDFIQCLFIFIIYGLVLGDKLCCVLVEAIVWCHINGQARAFIVIIKLVKLNRV